jgi:endonuclease YncB( thermonuclease family)
VWVEQHIHSSTACQSEVLQANVAPRGSELVGGELRECLVDHFKLDTLRVIDGEGQPRTLRLLAIDAPESGQAGGEVARDFVAARACGSSAVEWQSHGQDRYGRTVASVSIDGEDLAVALLRAGLVWRVRKYLDGQPAELQSAYEHAWRQARESRIGLWAGDPEPPWAWRQHSRPERGHGIDCSAYRGSLH